MIWGNTENNPCNDTSQLIIKLLTSPSSLTTYTSPKESTSRLITGLGQGSPGCREAMGKCAVWKHAICIDTLLRKVEEQPLVSLPSWNYTPQVDNIHGFKEILVCKWRAAVTTHSLCPLKSCNYNLSWPVCGFSLHVTQDRVVILSFYNTNLNISLCEMCRCHLFILIQFLVML